MYEFSLIYVFQNVKTFCLNIFACLVLVTKNSVMLLPTPHFTEMRFASFLFGEFNTDIVINPLEKKLAKRTSVQWDTNGNLLLLAILIQLLFAYVSKFKIGPWIFLIQKMTKIRSIKSFDIKDIKICTSKESI